MKALIGATAFVTVLSMGFRLVRPLDSDEVELLIFSSIEDGRFSVCQTQKG
jgi:hypothetical protein